MNPLGLLVLALGVLLIIVGVKGSQHNLVQALTNRKQQATTASSTNPSSSSSVPKGVTLV